MPRVLPYNDESIREGARRIAGGGVVAFATETVYGLGGDTFNPGAIARIYDLKQRPWNNPLIAHVLDTIDAQLVVQGWNASCNRLAARFWPGPLTLILPRHNSVPTEATGGLETLAVRSPRHPLARSFLYAVGGPVSAPSANRSGAVSPTCAQHVAADFPEEADLLILDGGSCSLGIESTVLDMTPERPVVRRFGTVSVEAIQAVIGAVHVHESTQQGASPGTQARHYAPTTPTRLADVEEIAALGAEVAATAVVLCFEGTAVPAGALAVRLPLDADAYARALYDALRRADAAGREAILIERPKQATGIWAAIHDRLNRACA